MRNNMNLDSRDLGLDREQSEAVLAQMPLPCRVDDVGDFLERATSCRVLCHRDRNFNWPTWFVRLIWGALALALVGASTPLLAQGNANNGGHPPFTGRGFIVAHVGDSRVYRSRGGALTQITVDHSWVSEQVRAGSMTEADARQHPWRNVVTRAIAGGDDPAVDLSSVAIEAGDRLMLCSDGLSGLVTDERCQEIIDAATSLDAACHALIDAANAAGGPDNITVALLKIDVE